MASEVNPADGFDPNPRSSRGFGPAEAADAARQAQFTESDDTPTDVNLNAIIARSQALTVDVLGKEFAANSDFRDKIQGRFLANVK